MKNLQMAKRGRREDSALDSWIKRKVRCPASDDWKGADSS
jgi:hypothetical protein